MPHWWKRPQNALLRVQALAEARKSADFEALAILLKRAKNITKDFDQTLDDDFARVVDTWIQLKQKDGTIAALYDYWILGRSAGGAAPRWSVLRDVLHWVD